MAPFEGDPAAKSLHELNANGLTGTCLCRSITISLTSTNLFASPNGHICHCLNCRRATGSSAWNVILLPSEHVRIEDPKGHMKVYMDGDTSTGNPIPRTFCSNCGSTLGNVPADGIRPTHVAIALGLFPRIPEPEFELFSAHRQAWLPPVVPSDRQYEYRAEMEVVS